MSKHSFFNRKKLISALELPQDVLFGETDLHMIGNEELMLTNHLGILLFEQERIVLMAKKYQIVIQGRNLVVDSFDADLIRIKGQLLLISFMPC